jgi:hypothetical protein
MAVHTFFGSCAENASCAARFLCAWVKGRVHRNLPLDELYDTCIVGRMLYGGNVGFLVRLSRFMRLEHWVLFAHVCTRLQNDDADLIRLFQNLRSLVGRCAWPLCVQLAATINFPEHIRILSGGMHMPAADRVHMNQHFAAAPTYPLPMAQHLTPEEQNQQQFASLFPNGPAILGQHAATQLQVAHAPHMEPPPMQAPPQHHAPQVPIDQLVQQMLPQYHAPQVHVNQQQVQQHPPVVQQDNLQQFAPPFPNSPGVLGQAAQAGPVEPPPMQAPPQHHAPQVPVNQQQAQQASPQQRPQQRSQRRESVPGALNGEDRV